MSKSSEQHQSNSRLGALGESLVQTFLLEYCDWCYQTQEKHPADLLVELGSAKYTIQVKTRKETKEGKYVFAHEPSRAKSEVYRHYHCDIYAFVFVGAKGKRIKFQPNNTTQNYFTFTNKQITKTLEIDSFKETLAVLTEVPVLRPLND
jgi:hypothetical protein|tara:strand:+ start:595 stop:1041 length:447 start_codon:yes stop_codon:yes gene_type:complete